MVARTARHGSRPHLPGAPAGLRRHAVSLKRSARGLAILSRSFKPRGASCCCTTPRRGLEFKFKELSMAATHWTVEQSASGRLILSVQSVHLTDEQFYDLCQDNPDLRFELTARK